MIVFSISREAFFETVVIFKSDSGRIKTGKTGEAHFKFRILGIFGSVARKEAKRSNNEATLIELVGMADYLKHLLGQKVDRVSERSLRQRLNPYVYKDMIPI